MRKKKAKTMFWMVQSYKKRIGTGPNTTSLFGHVTVTEIREHGVCVLVTALTIFRVRHSGTICGGPCSHVACSAVN